MTDEIRRRLTRAYGEERFTMTVSEIERRSVRGRRRRLAWATAGVVAMVLGAVAIGLTGTGWLPAPVSPAASLATPPWHEDFAADCQRNLHTAEVSQTEYALLYEVYDDDLGLRVYVSDQAWVPCAGVGWGGEEPGFESYLGGPVARKHGGGLSFGTTSISDSLTLIVGRVPHTATRVEAITGNTSYPAAIMEDLFVILRPDQELLLADTIIRASGPSGIQERKLNQEPGAVFIYPESGLKLPEAEAECRRQMAEFPVSSDREKLRLAFIGSASSVDGEETVLLFGGNEGFAPCRVRYDGKVQVGSVANAAPEQGWQPLQQIFESDSGLGYLLGSAPEGAIDGTVRLASGTELPLKFADGFYAAWWATDDPDEVAVRIEIETETERWVWQGNETHRESR